MVNYHKGFKMDITNISGVEQMPGDGGDNVIEGVDHEEDINLYEQFFEDMMKFAATGDLESMQRLVMSHRGQQPLDFQQKRLYRDYRTPLHMQSCYGHLPFVTFLCERCGLKLEEVCSEDRLGFTPLDDQRTEGHYDVVQYLEQHILSLGGDLKDLRERGVRQMQGLRTSE